MDFNALLEPAIQFSSEGIGAQLAKAGEFLYMLLYPSNAEGAVIGNGKGAAEAIQVATK
ncbi:hypothetical protein [Corynebacterium casei]|uniref:Uncharacterized protein n=1 Tax=Corynebacterium casei UCMA 3821 TaxID=1110505 RepID=G7HXT5_9CORY|nr:hypothetical protein [Corynebacterium casei]CCE55000.1 putative uncharacterized protein [Corynebacterium casei UCMA 3821]